MPFSAPFGVPWGSSLSGHLASSLPNSIVSSELAGQRRASGSRGWVSLASEGRAFLLYLSPARDHSLHLELNSGMLRAIALVEPNLPEHRVPKKEAGGRRS